MYICVCVCIFIYIYKQQFKLNAPEFVASTKRGHVFTRVVWFFAKFDSFTIDEEDPDVFQTKINCDSDTIVGLEMPLIVPISISKYVM